jgi:hypothetical protein
MVRRNLPPPPSGTSRRTKQQFLYCCVFMRNLINVFNKRSRNNGYLGRLVHVRNYNYNTYSYSSRFSLVPWLRSPIIYCSDAALFLLYNVCTHPTENTVSNSVCTLIVEQAAAYQRNPVPGSIAGPHCSWGI